MEESDAKEGFERVARRGEVLGSVRGLLFRFLEPWTHRGQTGRGC